MQDGRFCVISDKSLQVSSYLIFGNPPNSRIKALSPTQSDFLNSDCVGGRGQLTDYIDYRHLANEYRDVCAYLAMTCVFSRLRGSKIHISGGNGTFWAVTIVVSTARYDRFALTIHCFLLGRRVP